MSDKKSVNGVQLKKEWLSCRFEEGLQFQKLDVKGKVFIEYVPAEYAWAPVDAPGYMMINCFWVSGSFKGKGYGAALLDQCMENAKEKHGLVILTSAKKKPYLSDKAYLVKHGFEVCDTAPPYFELMVKRFNSSAPDPVFRASAKQGIPGGKEGLVVYYTNQCPFTDYYANDELEEIGQELGVPVERVRLTSREEAQNAPSAWATYSAFYNGKFLTHEILNKKKAATLLQRG
ncbi:GNAT family N-acetyltransferase [Paenibacillus turpanensis]|uniref:GNAT family N-acetyltransferase n=1 Tax=Paenibacillus turpanensis TaxID=2689078 RepID=UPI00140A429F|nr:GNAT family N-acetyltransferase [Paenibacillus turpanensis]